MKKLIYAIGLIIGFSAALQAQSKFSYSLLVNKSASTDDVIDVCIFNTTGGECLGLEKNWKTNVTLNVNYQLNTRVRLQTGLGYNVLSMDQLNEALETNEFKAKYLSIPMRFHYMITKGKTKLYAGVGIRTDIRLNNTRNLPENINLVDNSYNIALSAEGLIGLEIPLSSGLKINFEPTIATALTSYSKDESGPTGFVNSLVATPYSLVEEYPGRIGISLGITYGF